MLILAWAVFLTLALLSLAGTVNVVSKLSDSTGALMFTIVLWFVFYGLSMWASVTVANSIGLFG